MATHTKTVSITDDDQKLLSNDLNLTEINQAIPACSNETIIKNTMDWIYKNEKLINETIFIIGFTAESRSKFDWDFYDIILFQRFLESIDVNHILFFSFGKSHKDIFLDNFFLTKNEYSFNLSKK